MSGTVAEEVAESFWLKELFDKIDRMNHAIAQHGQILVDIANDDEADDPDARIGAYWIMRTCHEVVELRERLAVHGVMARELVQTVRDARAALDDRASASRRALTLSWSNGFSFCIETERRWRILREGSFSDGGGI